MVEVYWGRILRPTVTKLAAAVALLVLVAPLAAEAQAAGKVVRIGFISTSSLAASIVTHK